MPPRPDRLDVYHGQDLVGAVHDSAPLAFEYAPGWLFAFAIGGEVKPGEMGAEHLALMARQLGMQPRFLAQQAQDMADRVPGSVARAASELAPVLKPSARVLAERLERFVASTTRRMAARLTSR